MPSKAWRNRASLFTLDWVILKYIKNHEGTTNYFYFFPSQALFSTAWSEDRVNCHQMSCSILNSYSLSLNVSTLKFSVPSIGFIPHYILCFPKYMSAISSALSWLYQHLFSHLFTYSFFEYCVYRKEALLSTVRHLLNSQYNTRYYKNKCSDFQSP